MRHRLRAGFRAIDGASLAAFRVAFGGLMFTSVAGYLLSGRISDYYIVPSFHFGYFGFSWLPMPSPAAIYGLFVAILVAALGVMLGFWYRACATVFFLSFTYAFLLEQARYLNHYYLICILGFLLIFVPTHRVASIDARRHALPPLVPALGLWVFRAQLGLVYFYAGVAKLNADWIGGEPLRMWLAGRSDWLLIGPLFGEEWVILAMSWGGLLLDLLIAPLLLWRRTRPWAFAAAVAFHLMNALLFRIGVFPWLMIAATTLFFEPDWIRRRLGWPAVAPDADGVGDREVERAANRVPRPASRRMQQLALAGAAVWLALQVLIPLRHWLYPGEVSWTEEGHKYAWHMKLRSKRARAIFFVRDPETGETWRVDPRDELTPWQARKMSGRPDMVLDYAHHLAERFEEEHGRRIEVRAEVRASLNGRRPQRLIDPTVDLAAEPSRLGPQPFILPLEPHLEGSEVQTPKSQD